MEVYLITKIGYDKMAAELRQLKQSDRPEVIKAIADAREHGDLRENAEYHAAKEKQSFIEGRILDLENKIARANIIDPSAINDTKIRFGATVQIMDETTEKAVTYQIVSDYESDVSQGKISIASPLARQLLGKSEGDNVTITAPKGEKYYSVISVKYLS